MAPKLSRHKQYLTKPFRQHFTDWDTMPTIFQETVRADGDILIIDVTDTTSETEMFVQFVAGYGILKWAIRKRIYKIETVDAEKLDQMVVAEIRRLIATAHQLVLSRFECEVAIYDIRYHLNVNFPYTPREAKQRLVDSLNELEQLDTRATRAVNRHAVARLQAKIALLPWYSPERWRLARLSKEIRRE